MTIRPEAPSHTITLSSRRTGIGDHARVDIVVDRDRLAQLLAGEVVEHGVPALRHGELAERRIVEAELMLVALAEESECGGRAEIAERQGPLTF